MRIHGLGELGSTWPSNTPQVDACGPSPCTWWDNIYNRDPCIAYMACAIPTDPTTVSFTEGTAAGVGAEVGQTAGGVVSGIGTGLSGMSPSTLMLIGAAIGLLIVFRK